MNSFLDTWWTVIYITGVVGPWLLYFDDMRDNNFDAWFSDKTLRKLRVKDNSFLRKIIPFKEFGIVDGQYQRIRYFLYPRAMALFLQSIFIILSVPMCLINQFLIKFMPSYIFGIFGASLLGVWIIYQVLMPLE